MNEKIATVGYAQIHWSRFEMYAKSRCLQWVTNAAVRAAVARGRTIRPYTVPNNCLLRKVGPSGMTLVDVPVLRHFRHQWCALNTMHMHRRIGVVVFSPRWQWYLSAFSTRLAQNFGGCSLNYPDEKSLKSITFHRLSIKIYVLHCTVCTKTKTNALGAKKLFGERFVRMKNTHKLLIMFCEETESTKPQNLQVLFLVL